MHKKIFTTLFFLLCGFIFFQTQYNSKKNGINLLTIEDREQALENSFPTNNVVKEIYGLSNNILSPNEKITGTMATIKDNDGFLQLINYIPTEKVDNAKNNISQLNEHCKENDIEFTFIFYPSKSNEHTLSSAYGIDTNYEEIRNEFLTYLDGEEINHLDMRKTFEDNGYTTKDIFYKTDHHWNTFAGFFASQQITKYLNDTYDWSLDTAALNTEKFTYQTYKNLWFGETGRSLSLSWVNQLDDFTVIKPQYETSISLRYSDGTENSGDFSMLIDDSGFERNNNYYSYSAYYSYSLGMNPPVTYHNNFSDKNGKKILFIKDSFSVVVIPFLTLSTSDITVWDMRDTATNHGLYQYISENNFDIVIVAYTDYWSEDIWNFR